MRASYLILNKIHHWETETYKDHIDFISGVIGLKFLSGIDFTGSLWDLYLGI